MFRKPSLLPTSTEIAKCTYSGGPLLSDWRTEAQPASVRCASSVHYSVAGVEKKSVSECHSMLWTLNQTRNIPNNQQECVKFAIFGAVLITKHTPTLF